jgi:hypothetical protein
LSGQAVKLLSFIKKVAGYWLERRFQVARCWLLVKDRKKSLKAMFLNQQRETSNQQRLSCQQPATSNL